MTERCVSLRMWVILGFFVAHWVLCVFLQSFFQHRYAAHRMFQMGPRMERAVHLLTFLVQGTSYLNPRTYAWLHREHHAFSDTERDPHTPHRFRDAGAMMWATFKRYEAFRKREVFPEQRFQGGYPEWKLIDETLANSKVVSLLFMAAYASVYAVFATSWWLWLLLPVHFVLGPVHGAIVNWCGHKYGYRNFESSDLSRNSLPMDFLTMGELFQNNHHTWGMSPNFAARRWELDPTWQVMRVLAKVGLIEVTSPQRAVWPLPHGRPVGAEPA